MSVVCSSGIGKLGERLGDLFELELAALRDVPGAVERVLHFAEQRHHLFARLEVERFLLEAHAVQIRHGLAGLNAQQDFVRAGVGLAQVVRIVGGDQRNAGVRRQAMHQRHALCASCSRPWSCSSRKKFFGPNRSVYS